MISLEQLLAGTKGQLLYTHEKKFSAVGTDSRQDLTGKIFFPLKGDAFDGHDFIAQAFEQGAAAVVSHRPPADNLKDKVTWVQVEDTLLALQTMAHYWRCEWGGKLIAITGSNGKTTVKDFTHTLLSGTYSTLKNEGSFNNHWGLPLTILRLRSEHQWGVVEMGMNHKGEITELVKMAEPNVVTVTMVGTAHIESFGSIEGIAAAKEEIYENADKNGVAVFNLKNPLTRKMYETWSSQFCGSLTFAKPTSDVYLEVDKKLPRGLRVRGQIGGVDGATDTLIWGEHNVHNLMAAAVLALASGVLPEHIWQRLSLCEMGWGRNQWVPLQKGMALFDGYNANPESFRALLENIEDLKSEFSIIIGVFGEMRELGAQAEEAHFVLGQEAARSVVDCCYFFGPSATSFARGFESQKTRKKLVISVTYQEKLAIEIGSMLDSQTLAVVKGSRGMELERVVQKLEPINFKKK
ncbi:MAG: UDP-N-acetylmuramoyl-tripeptide--D-alanyl-D-alanine ligase [Bdellovibrionaceae bacterium]|nr:UDP-N-acetylmuramoyl-tripeptide--D-alanyl-D-alanine ligase [Pseudobdellovibrionaceae bacterium]